MLQMNLIIQEELCGEVCHELYWELRRELYGELWGELYWGLYCEVYRPLGSQIRTNFSLSKILRV
jgi:hypothetical protein